MPATSRRPAPPPVTRAPAAGRPLAAKKAGRNKIVTRRSEVHGKGVFAAQDIAAGETLIEYVGEVISWPEAQRRHPHDPTDPNHTFYFHIDEDRVIDAKFGGNASRWINHSCAPNCEADEDEGRVLIKALRDIAAGEELNYDYGLIIDEPLTKALKAEYPCWCGAPECRGTLLAPPDEDDGKKKKGARIRRKIRKLKKKLKARKDKRKGKRKSGDRGDGPDAVSSADED